MGGIWQNVDLYCERTGPEYWSEPLNALTNLLFVVAGLWGLSLIRHAGAGRFAEVLAWWVAAIGVGSWLFHTHANRLTMWADILPIAGFTIVYIIYNLRRFMGYSWPKTFAIFVAYAAVIGTITALMPQSVHAATNGSIGYLPAFAALLFFGWLDIREGSAAGWYNIAAAGLFVLSATFRSIDAAVCDAIPFGTHFLWHTINAIMLGVILLAIARHSPRAGERA